MADKFKGANFPNYFKNVSKSVAYTASDIVKQNLPAVDAYTSTNSEITKATVDSVKNINRTAAIIKRKIESSGVSKDIKDIMKNALEDARTGNIYNKKRMQSTNIFGDDEVDGWGDFSSFDDNFDSSSSSTKTTKKKTPSGDVLTKVNVVNNVMNGATDKQSRLSVKLTQASNANSNRNTYITNAMHTQFHRESMGEMQTINENIGNMVNFHNNTLNPMIEKTMNYYNDSISEQRNIVALLRESLDIQKAGFSPQNNQQQQSSSDVDNVLGMRGELNIAEYYKTIGKNAKTYISNSMGMDLESMFKGMGANPLKEIAASPLSFMSKALTNKLLPDFFKQATADLNDTIENFGAGWLMKMNSMKDDDNPIFKAIGNIFGINLKSKKDVDISNYNKGAIPFDGVTKKAITDVMPALLSKIHSAILGLTDELVVDYNKGGQLSWKSDKEREFKDIKRNAGMLGLSDFDTAMKGKMEAFQFNDPKKQEQFYKDFDNMKVFIRDLGSKFDPNNEETMGRMRANTGMSLQNSDLLTSIFNSLPRKEKMKLFNQMVSADSFRTRTMNDLEKDSSMNGLAQIEMGSTLTSKNVQGANGKVDQGLFTVLDKIRSVLVQGIIVFPKTGGGKKGGGSLSQADKEYRKLADQRLRSELDDIRLTAQRKNDAVRDKFDAEDRQYAEYHKSVDEGRGKGRMVIDGSIDYDDMNQLNRMVKGTTNSYERRKKESEKGKKKDGFFDEFFKGQDTFWKKLQKVYEQPFKMATGFLNSVDQKLYEVIYGPNASDRDKKKGMVETIVDSIRHKIMSVTELFKTKVLDRFMEKMFDPAMNWIGKHVTDKVLNPARGVLAGGMEKLFGIKGEDGKRDNSGVLSEVRNTMKETFGQIKGFITGEEVRSYDGKRVLSKKTENSVVGNMKLQFGQMKRGLGNYLFGKGVYDDDGNFRWRERGGLFTNVLDGFMDGFGHLKGQLLGKDNKFGEQTKELTDKFKKYLPAGATGGTLGLIGSIFLPGGPLMGAAIGATLGIAKSSGKLDEWLFGKEKDGKQFGGLFKRELKAEFKELAPKAVSGGVFGAIGGLFLPGGPLVGAMVGSGMAIVANSETLKKTLFGEMGEDGKRSGAIISRAFQDRFPGIKTGMGVGAIGGLFLPGGPIVGAIVGGVIGHLSGGKAFKRFLWGDWDPNTKTGKKGIMQKAGGYILHQVTRPFKSFFDKQFEKTKNWLVKDIFTPLKFAMKPIGKEVGHMFKSIGKGLSKIFEKTFGSRITKLVGTLFGWVQSGLQKVTGGLLGALRGVFTLPVKLITASSERMYEKQLGRGQWSGDEVADREKGKKRAERKEKVRHGRRAEELGIKEAKNKAEAKEYKKEAKFEDQANQRMNNAHRKAEKAFRNSDSEKEFKKAKKNAKNAWKKGHLDDRTYADSIQGIIQHRENTIGDNRKDILGKELDKRVKKEMKKREKIQFGKEKKSLDKQLRSGAISKEEHAAALSSLDDNRKNASERIRKEFEGRFGLGEGNKINSPDRKDRTPRSIGSDGEVYEGVYNRDDVVSNSYKDKRHEVNNNRQTSAQERDNYYNQKANELNDKRQGVVNQVIDQNLKGIDPSEYNKIGQNVIDGIMEGLQSRSKDLGSLVDQITETEIKKRITDKMDIHSPSRVTKEYGHNIGDGLIEGINDKKGDINSAFEGMFEGTAKDNVIHVDFQTGEKTNGKKGNWFSNAMDKLIVAPMRKMVSTFSELFKPIKGIFGAVDGKFGNALSSAFKGFKSVGKYLWNSTLGKTPMGMALTSTLMTMSPFSKEGNGGIMKKFSGLFGGKPKADGEDPLIGRDYVQVTKEHDEKAQRNAVLTMSDSMSQTAKNTGGLLKHFLDDAKAKANQWKNLLKFLGLGVAGIMTAINGLSFLKDLGNGFATGGLGGGLKAAGEFIFNKDDTGSSLFGTNDKYNPDGTEKGQLQQLQDRYQTGRGARRLATSYVTKKMAKNPNWWNGKLKNAEAVDNMASGAWRGTKWVGGKAAKGAGKLAGTKAGQAALTKIRPIALATGIHANVAKDAIKNSSPVQKLLGMLSNPKVQSKLPKGAGAAIKKALPYLAKKLSVKGAATIVGKAIAKYNPYVGPVLLANDFVTGMTDVRRILEIPPDSEPTAGMRLTAGVSRMISGLTLGLVPEGWITNLIYKAVGGKDGQEQLAGMRAQLAEDANDAGFASAGHYSEVQNKGFWKKGAIALGLGKSKKQEIKEYRDSVQKQLDAAIASGDTQKQAKLQEQLAKLDKTMKGTKNTWYEASGNAVKKGASAVANVTKKGWNATVKGTKALGRGIANVSRKAWDGTKDIASKTWEGTKNLASNAWEGTKNMAGKVVDGVKDLGEKVWESTPVKIMRNVTKSVGILGKAVFDGVVNVGSAIVERTKKELGKFGKWMGKKWDDFTAWTSEKWKDWVTEPIGKAMGWISNKWTEFSGWVGDKWNTWVAEPVGKAMGWIGDKWNEFSGWFGDKWNTWVAEPVGKAMGWIGNKWDEFSGWAGDKWNTWVAEPVSGAMNWVGGKFTAIGGWVDEKFTDWVLDPVKGAMQFVGKQYDKVTDWVGEKTDEYIVKPVKSVVNSIGKIFNKVFGFFDKIGEFLSGEKLVELAKKGASGVTGFFSGLADKIRGEGGPYEPLTKKDLASFIKGNNAKGGPTEGLTAPVDPRFPITSKFGPRKDPFNGQDAMHNAVDIGAPEGAPIKATAGGRVVKASKNGAYGNMVEIDHGDGVISRYGHMKGFGVKKGDLVDKGQPIGGVGNTGNSTGSHLHFEMRQNDQPFDPTGYVTSGGSSCVDGVCPPNMRGAGGPDGQLNPTTKKIVQDYTSLEGKLQYSQSGPRNPDKGSADCSSSIDWAYKKDAGFSIGGFTGDQIKVGTKVDGGPVVGETANVSNLVPGDLLFYKGDSPASNMRPHGVGHIEMYRGDGKTTGHGSGIGPKVKNFSTYRTKEYIMAKRVLDPVTGKRLGNTMDGNGATPSGLGAGVDGGGGGDTTNTNNSTLDLNDPTSSLIGESAKYFTALLTGKTYDGANAPANNGGGDGGGDNVESVTLKGNNNAQKVWNFFKSQGFSSAATAGIMGNLQQESGIDPTKKQYGGGPGRGIMQWETGSDRFASLERYAASKGKKWDDIDAQVAFMWSEMNNPKDYSRGLLERKYGGMDKLKATNDYKYAVNTFERSFERAGKPMYENRYKYAKGWLDTYGGGQGGPFEPIRDGGQFKQAISSSFDKKKPALGTFKLNRLVGTDVGGMLEASKNPSEAAKRFDNPDFKSKGTGGPFVPLRTNAVTQNMSQIKASISDYQQEMTSKINQTMDADHIAKQQGMGSKTDVPWDRIIQLLEDLNNSNNTIAENTSKVVNEGIEIKNNGSDIKSDSSNNNALTAIQQRTNVNNNNVFLGRAEESRQKVSNVLRGTISKVASGN